ncbi:MAG: pentapeptide repeat-containing protein [Alphaproteobacteria bacterium]|jgi:uncharacterized protein YjbI with pentapeptide repeats|nr:pentapeptide repeat-containing protein [Alphaproteobacteria bacterium]
MISRSFIYWGIILGLSSIGFGPLGICQAMEYLALTDEEVQPPFTSSPKRSSLSSECLDEIYKRLISHNTLSEAEFNQRFRDQQFLDFRALDLRGLDLSTYDLRYADFSKCKMRGVIFYGALLCYAKFEGADLSKADCRKSDLTGADFERAILNGARFKGAKILDVKIKGIRSAKGTLFADLRGLSSKQAHEQEIKDKISDLTGNPLSMMFEGSCSLSEIHQTLFENLCELQRQSHSHTMVDFRNLQAIKDQSAESPIPLTALDLHELTKEFAEILRSPYFKGLVERIYPQYDHSIIVVQMKLLGGTLEDRIKKNSLKMPRLDLHGKIPLSIKYKWVEKFVKASQARGCPSVEIVTGRGLNNPSGIMGVQWTIFKDILTSEKYQPYVEDIHSTSKNGGWIVDLKNPNQKITNTKKISPKSRKDKRVGKRDRKNLKDHKEAKFLKRATLRDEKYIPNLHEKEAKLKPVKAKTRVLSKRKRRAMPPLSIKGFALIPALGVVESPQPVLVKGQPSKAKSKAKSSRKKKKADKKKAAVTASSSVAPNVGGLQTTPVSASVVTEPTAGKKRSIKPANNLTTTPKLRGKMGTKRNK